MKFFDREYEIKKLRGNQRCFATDCSGYVRGVTKVTVHRRQRMSSYERSLRDLEEGRVYEYDSLDDLIKEIEG